MPPREGESEEEYRERKKRERKEKEARGGGGSSKHEGETEEERKIRKEKERAERHAASADKGGEEKKETEEERRERKEKERAERHARRAAEEKEKAAASASADAPEESSKTKDKRDETEEERRERKERERAERHAAKRSSETEEERRARKEKERAERERGSETEEERRERKERERAERKEKERQEQQQQEASTEKKETAEDPDPENTNNNDNNKRRASRSETEEERRERKERERAERKEKERAERKERERREAAGEDKKPGTPQTVRERLEARANKGKGKDGSSSPSKNNNDDNNNESNVYDQGYEDDFEEVYDADELSAAQRAMERENEAIRNKAKQKAAVPASAAFVEAEGVARAGFDRKSLEEQKAKAQFDKDFQRASALRRVVDLEEVRFGAVADIAPLSQYDMFVRGVGGVARNTVGENMPERSSIEIQAERVVMKSKGCSVPIDLGLDPETAMSSNQQGGTSSSSKGDSETAIAALARRSVDTASLSKFLSKAGGVVLALLDEENEIKEQNAKGGDQNKQQSSLISFATQSSSFRAPFLENRPVTRVAVSPSTSQYFLAVHGTHHASSPQQQQQQMMHSATGGSGVFAGLVTIWNVHSHQQCEKVLVAFSEIKDACFSRSRPYLIYGGTVSGAVCVWDLREPAHAHGGHGVGAGSTAFRLPSFTTDSTQYMNHTAPIQRVVSCGAGGSSSSGGGSLGSGGSDSAESGSVEQITSVDRTGCLSFWVLNESEQSNEAAVTSGGSSSAFDSSSSKNNNNKDSNTSSGAAALESLVSASMSTASCVRLHRMGTGNTLDTNRGMKSSASISKSAAATTHLLDSGSDVISSVSASGKKESSGIVATVTDMEQSPIDATRLVVSAYTGVAHVSRFGSIAAPISYGPTRLVAGPGIAPSAVIGAGMTAASTCVASCRSDSRLLLVGYADGTLRLYLRVDTAPKLTVLSAEHQSIVSVCFAPNTKWLAFALDAAGNIFALDFAIPGSRTKPFAQAKVVRNSTDVATSLTTFVDERPETRLLVGFKSGATEIYTFLDSTLAPAAKRDMYWL